MSAEKIYSINFTKNNKKFCLSLHYNGANSYLLVNGTQIYKSRARDSKTVVIHYVLETFQQKAG